MKMDKKCVNCTLVGDGMVGKTTLAQTFAGLEMEDNYIATVFENYAGSISVAGERYTISIYDTAGQHDYSNMRAFTYKDSEVFLLCYSVGDRESFNSIKHFWLPEIKKFMGKKCPIIVVANQIDTREADGESVSKDEGLYLAKDIGADGYIEVSSALHEGISTTFEKVAMTALKYRKKKSKILQKLLGYDVQGTIYDCFLPKNLINLSTGLTINSVLRQVCFTLGTSRTVLRNEIKIYDKITKHHSPVKLLPNSCASHQSRSVVTFSVLYKQSKKADNTLGNTPDPVNEKTFDYQDKLPSLPVPDLSQTLRKYLNSAKPHLTEEEYRNTEVVVQNFEDGIGTHLQEKLLKRASSMRNWLETWWEDFLYLEGRDPIAPLVSFGVLGPYHYDYYQPQEGTQLERAATIVNFTLKYWKMIRTECLQPEKDKRGNPLCMNQFMKAFNNCRIPGLHKDRLISYFKTESQGVTPVHLVVLYNGRIFTFDALDENEDPLTPLELRLQFQRIIDMCKGEQVGPALGTLTGDNRTRWAENRSRLLALHPDNFNSLEIIQSSILVVSFDDYRPTDESDLMRNIIGGDPRNRWFDKGQCMVFYRNGLLATVCDHGPADAMVFVASTMYTYSQLMQCNGQWEGNTVIRDQNQPRELVFHIDDEITHEVERSAQLFTETANNIDCIIRHFQGYGKTYLRSKGLHPETHVQLAIQYAYFKLYNKPASTLQTATIRKFYHGRTETMRSCTVESGEWTKAMIDSNMSNQDKTELYLKAADTHNKLMSEVTNLQGCDRHLFGLKRIAEEEGIPVPDLYKDIAYARSGRGRIFTLMTSCIGYTGVSVGGTAATENAYVICYRIPSDEIVPTILTWKSSEETDAEQFCYTLFGCFEDMKRMLDSAKH